MYTTNQICTGDLLLQHEKNASKLLTGGECVQIYSAVKKYLPISCFQILLVTCFLYATICWLTLLRASGEFPGTPKEIDRAMRITLM